MGPFAARLRLIGTENAFKIGPRIEEVEAAGHRVIRCNLGEPDFELADEIREEVKRQLDARNTHYSDPQGLPQLRAAVARQLSETRGLGITPERVVIFPGAKPAIGLCQQAYVDPGDEVVYPSPGFPIYESFTGFVGAVPQPLFLAEERGFSLDGSDLARVLSARTRLIYLNFPSNPTGGVATREQLEEIAQAIRSCAPGDVRVFSDEVYEAMPTEERECSSPSTLFQLFLLYRYHVATMDRRSFGVIGSEGQHFLRISVATALTDLEEAIRRIAAAAADREGFQSFFHEGRHGY